jgi:hypothetical protein
MRRGAGEFARAVLLLRFAHYVAYAAWPVISQDDRRACVRTLGETPGLELQQRR